MTVAKLGVYLRIVSRLHPPVFLPQFLVYRRERFMISVKLYALYIYANVNRVKSGCVRVETAIFTLS